MGVYSTVISGWASNSKYAFIGCVRSIAQLISYELNLGFILAAVGLCAGSLNLVDIVLAQEDVYFC